MQKLAEKNDLLFRRWYNENIVRFIGGPLHDEVRQVDALMPETYVLDMEPMQPIDFTKTIDPSARVGIRLVKYELIRDGFVVHPLVCIRWMEEAVMFRKKTDGT